MKNKKMLRAMLPALGVLAILLAGCHSDKLPNLDHPRLAQGVALQDVKFFSASLQREMRYRVFLPATVAPGQLLPVVYLLHGHGDNYRDWSNHTDVARYAASSGGFGGLILVMPDGDSSYYMNAALRPEDRYEDYLVNDLTADVEGRLPAAKGRQSRAIVGVSMGGFAAVKLALSRPELFVFGGAISPAIDVPSRRFSLRRWEQSLRFRSIFGPENSETRRKSDPFILVDSADPARTPYLYLTAQDQEPLLEPNQRFVARLKQRGYSYEFHTQPGGHDWGEWNRQLPGCFKSLLQHLKAGR
jgi:S-formylglutathione hydrolase FrmB